MSKLLQAYASTVVHVNAPNFVVHGANRAIGIEKQLGGYVLSGSLQPEPWWVHLFTSWLMDTNDKLVRGAAIQLGQLTGESDSALAILKGGYQGDNGDPHVVLRGPFRSDWGLVTYLFKLPIGETFYLRTVVLYEPT